VLRCAVKVAPLALQHEGMHGHRVTVAREDAALLHLEKVHPVAAAGTQQQWPEPDIVLDRNPDPLDLRTRRAADNETALLAVILADATNFGLSRMAEASQGVTRNQLLWTREAYIRDETYRAALARIVDAHNALPIASVWGDGTTSASDGQFFRSGKRGDAAGEVNARYGVDPGLCGGRLRVHGGDVRRDGCSRAPRLKS
jgi:hypothetical protein